MSHFWPTYSKVPVTLITDASGCSVGALCEQCVDGIWQPFAFIRRMLRDAERKYSEFLAR